MCLEILVGTCSEGIAVSWREEKWTQCHPFLTQHSTHTLPFILFFKWLTVKEDGENTSGKRCRHTHLFVRAYTHTHTQMLAVLVAVLHLSAY